MPTPGTASLPRKHCSAFTLIEVLVVVAILGILVGIMLPSLARAKEQSRQAVCLSNLKQQGSGFSAYSSDHRGALPRAGQFRYSLMEGRYYTEGRGNADWVTRNAGMLYPKYIGRSLDLFYCPSNKEADANLPLRGKSAFLQRYTAWKSGSPGYVTAHDFGNSPIGAYAYALPAVGGSSPRDAGSKMYPTECMVRPDEKGAPLYSPFHSYMTDETELSADEARKFLGPFPREKRGQHAIHALLTDAYFGGYQGYHLNGFNVLFGDMHVKRVADPRGVIIKGVGGGSKYTPGDLAGSGKPFMVWDYFSTRP